MKNKFVSLTITILLLFILVLVFFFNASSLYIGPYLKQYDEDQVIYNQFIENIKSEHSSYVGKYILNETVYIATILLDSNQYFMWYDKSANLLDKRELSSYDIKLIEDKANELELADYSVQLGWYKKPTIVLNDENQEILLDYDTLEIVLIYKKEVV